MHDCLLVEELFMSVVSQYGTPLKDSEPDQFDKIGYVQGEYPTHYCFKCTMHGQLELIWMKLNSLYAFICGSLKIGLFSLSDTINYFLHVAESSNKQSSHEGSPSYRTGTTNKGAVNGSHAYVATACRDRINYD